MKNKFNFATISQAIEQISLGKMIIVVDDEDRENEGDLVMAAQFVTPEAINFMITYGRGLVCVPMIQSLADKLHLNSMEDHNTDPKNTAFLASLDAKEHFGVSTGISASDRAKTIQRIIHSNASAADFSRPGHIFPLLAREMGVLKRAGHTEASVDLSKLAGLIPAGVICEIIDENGEMRRGDSLYNFAKENNLPIITIKDLIQYRLSKQLFVEKIESVKLPTKFGEFDMICYRDTINGFNHIALVKGDVHKQKNILVRVHSECLTGDLFGSLRCDCGPQMDAALSLIQKEGNGVFLYMRQEGRGIGLEQKLKAYRLQEKGLDTVEANNKLGYKMDLREYGVGAQILLDLGVKSMNLITNNPTKIVGLKGYGLSLNKRVPLHIKPNKHNKNYLNTKFDRMGHLK